MGARWDAIVSKIHDFGMIDNNDPPMFTNRDFPNLTDENGDHFDGEKNPLKAADVMLANRTGLGHPGGLAEITEDDLP